MEWGWQAQALSRVERNSAAPPLSLPERNEALIQLIIPLTKIKPWICLLHHEQLSLTRTMAPRANVNAIIQCTRAKLNEVIILIYLPLGYHHYHSIVQTWQLRHERWCTLHPYPSTMVKILCTSSSLEDLSSLLFFLTSNSCTAGGTRYLPTMCTLYHKAVLPLLWAIYLLVLLLFFLFSLIYLFL